MIQFIYGKPVKNTAPSDMWVLHFKTQPTVAFFAAINQIFSQVEDNSFNFKCDWWKCKNKAVGWELNFRVHTLLKVTGKRMGNEGGNDMSSDILCVFWLPKYNKKLYWPVCVLLPKQGVSGLFYPQY